ncbi:uncharacterized protein LOC144706028 [Wolffia australiana]
MLADFCDILGPFYRTTKYVSGLKIVRVMEVIRILKALMRHINTILLKFDMSTIFASGRKMTAVQIASIRKACESMKSKMLKYERMISKNCATTTAVILDPFNKGVSLESSDVQEALAFVRRLMPQHGEQDLICSDTEDEDWLAELIDGVAPDREKEQRVPTPAEELEAYLQSMERKDNETTLGWWARIGAQTYPRLSTLAQEFLSVCATSALVERLFSAERAVVTFKRARLSAESIELLVTVKCLLRAVNAQLCDGDRVEDFPDDED